MKKQTLLLALTSIAFALGSQAQSTTFGVRAGVNFQNINGKESTGGDTKYKLKTGFNVGVNAEIPVAEDFYLQPGVLFTTKGAKGDKDAFVKKWNIPYIEVPINFLYKPELGDGKLLLGIGPYIAFAVGGKVTDQNSKEWDIEYKNEIKLSQWGLAYYAKRMDFGGNLLVGYELSSKLSAQLNAQLGMVKINTKITDLNPPDKTKYKNTGFGVSLGYRF